MRIVGLIIAAGTLLAAVGDPRMILDVPSAIIVLGFILGSLIFARADLPGMLTASLAAEATADRLRSAADAWRQFRHYALASGFLGTLTGLIVLLAEADDVSSLGPGTAMALSTLLYGVFLAYGVGEPIESRLRDRAKRRQGE